jgi:hypothetical protein
MPRDKRTEPDETPSPQERHREFSEENGRWNSEVEEALSELDELAQEPESPSSDGERTPA